MDFKKYAKKINIDIELDLFKVIDSKEHDIKSRYIEFSIFNNNKSVDLTNVTVSVFAMKPDQTIIYNNCEKLGGNKVLFELTSQFLAVEGLVEAELILVDAAGSKLSSKIFKVNVLRCINDDSALESSNEIGVIGELIQDVEEAKNNIGIVGSAKDALDRTIAEASSKDSILTNTIQDAFTAESQVDATITAAHGVTDTLNITINSAQQKNTQLTNNIKSADNKIVELNNLIASGDISNLVHKSEITDVVRDADITDMAKRSELAASMRTESLTVDGQANISDISTYGIRSLGKFGALTGHVNTTNTFDSAIVPGEYYVSSNDPVPDGPDQYGTYGKLIVYTNHGDILNGESYGNWLWQIFYSTENNEKFSRTKLNNGAWSEWVRFGSYELGHQYPAMKSPVGDGNDWLRVPKVGLLPYANGGSALGTSTWRYSEIWADAMYSTNIVQGSHLRVQGSGKYGQLGTGASDVYIHNSKSDKYLQIHDDGALYYAGALISWGARAGDKLTKDNIIESIPDAIAELRNQIKDLQSELTKLREAKNK